MDDPTTVPELGQAPSDENSVDDAAKTSYDKSKDGGKLFSKREKNRVKQEAPNSEETWSKWPKQNGGGLDGSN